MTVVHDKLHGFFKQTARDTLLLKTACLQLSARRMQHNYCKILKLLYDLMFALKFLLYDHVTQAKLLIS